MPSIHDQKTWSEGKHHSICRRKEFLLRTGLNVKYARQVNLQTVYSKNTAVINKLKRVVFGYKLTERKIQPFKLEPTRLLFFCGKSQYFSTLLNVANSLNQLNF